MHKKINKIASMTLALMLASSSLAFATEPDEKDWKGEPYEQAVDALIEAGIVTGDVDGQYHPNSTLTRAQACKIVIATIEPSTSDLTGTITQKPALANFKDLAGYDWAKAYIGYAASHGIVNGYPDGTFKPADNVSVAELCAMLVRAAKVKEDTIVGTWPQNYVDKASELGYFDNTGLVDQYGAHPTTEKATKWMAAWLTYNAMTDIQNANPKQELPQGTDKDTANEVPSTDGMKYAQASFDSNITSFDGKSLSSDIVIYSYGVEKDYSAKMELSGKKADYRLTNIYKLKSVSTKAWYRLEGNKIVEMIVPADIGFTGKAYAVLNGRSDVLAYDDQKAVGLDTLTATKEIMWLAFDDHKASVPSDEQIKESIRRGDLYEITLKDGEITHITKDPASKKGRMFDDLTFGAYATVTDVDIARYLVTTSSKLIELKDNASIYIADTKNGCFEAGKPKDIKKGDSLRAYDVSDDDDSCADIIVIYKN